MHRGAAPWGVLGVATTSSRRFGADDLRFLQSAANVVGAAIERHRVEQVLVESQARLDLALDTAGLGIWEYHFDEDRVWASPSLERLLGFEPGTFDNDPQSVLERVHPDDLDAVIAALRMDAQQRARVAPRVPGGPAGGADALARGARPGGGGRRRQPRPGRGRRRRHHRAPPGRGDPVGPHGARRGGPTRRRGRPRALLVPGRGVGDPRRVARRRQHRRPAGRARRAAPGRLGVRRPARARWAARPKPRWPTPSRGEPTTPGGYATSVATWAARACGACAGPSAPGRADFVPDISDDDLCAVAGDAEHLALLRRLAPRSAVAVPLLARGQAVGGLTLVRSEGSLHFDDDDLALVEGLAARAAVALDNARLYEDRERVVRALQETLLPPALPDIAGLDVAARYRVAEGGIDIGGDFYDVFPLPGDAWAVVVGDVSGKGPSAAAVTGMVRHALPRGGPERAQPGAGAGGHQRRAGCPGGRLPLLHRGAAARRGPRPGRPCGGRQRGAPAPVPLHGRRVSLPGGGAGYVARRGRRPCAHRCRDRPGPGRCADPRHRRGHRGPPRQRPVRRTGRARLPVGRRAGCDGGAARRRGRRCGHRARRGRHRRRHRRRRGEGRRRDGQAAHARPTGAAGLHRRLVLWLILPFAMRDRLAQDAVPFLTAGDARAPAPGSDLQGGLPTTSGT